MKVFALLIASLASAALAAPVTLKVNTAAPGPALNKSMWGIFFEDINFAGDGGLHAELIKNRSFEFKEPLMGWKADKVTIARDKPYTEANPNYATLADGATLTNEGYRGVGVKRGANYDFSVAVRKTAGDALLRVELLSDDGKPIASTALDQLPGEWTVVNASLTPTADANKGSFRVTLTGGSADVDHVSLYPRDTWQGRKHGLRKDFVQLLADLKPGFVRFPGGCIVEGHDLSLRYQWKKTIGRPEDRPTLWNRWNDEFKHRPTPDYYQSFGVGFFEFFQLCEDIGAKPMPILNCGMACQFNSKELAPMDGLEPYIQDALDLIEFANGPDDSTWGKKRADMGHAEPFGLTMIGVGNEQWGPQYVERYEAFAKVLKEKHPEIELIAAAGPSPDGKDFDFAWEQFRRLKPDYVDEHYYRRPEWFFDQSKRYDKYDRSGPKVFAGEYAAQSVDVVRPDNKNTWETALSEAALMTGLERNGDVVRLAAYAPLSAHVDAWQWTPNLIWFDNLRAYGTPNYYVQQLFSTNAGDVILPIELAGDVPMENDQPRVYASATKRRVGETDEIILKLVNATDAAVPVEITLAGREGKVTGTITTLAGDRATENSFEKPKAIAPREGKLDAKESTFTQNIPPRAVVMLKVK